MMAADGETTRVVRADGPAKGRNAYATALGVQGTGPLALTPRVAHVPQQQDDLPNCETAINAAGTTTVPTGTATAHVASVAAGPPLPASPMTPRGMNQRQPVATSKVLGGERRTEPAERRHRAGGDWVIYHAKGPQHPRAPI